MGSINNEWKMSCVSLNHLQFTLIWRLIAGCKLPTALAMNMISILIFSKKTLINTITLYQNLSHTFLCIPFSKCGSHRVCIKADYGVISLYLEPKASYDKIDLFTSFPPLKNNLIKKGKVREQYVQTEHRSFHGKLQIYVSALYLQSVH